MQLKTWLAPSPLAAVLVLLAATAAAPPAADVERLAAGSARFARLFLEGQDQEIDAMMAAVMLAAFQPAQRAQIRSGLAQQYGAVTRIDDAWHEDDVQGYRRFRVPVVFAKGTLDVRVVMDGDGRVAGLFFVPHVDRAALAAPANAPDHEIEATVGEGENGLPGLLTLPAGQGPFPAVVLVHGSGPNDRDETLGINKPFRDLAWGLAERGVAAVRFDKRSLVRPQELVGLGEALTVKEEVIDDALAALRLLRGRPEIDAGRVFVLGHSLGGMLVPRIAASADPRPAGVVALAGATLPLPEKMLSQMRYIAEADGAVTDDERARLAAVASEVAVLRGALAGKAPAPPGMHLGAPVGYYRDLEAHDPPAEAVALGLPILVLQGERDYQATMEDFARWQAALAGRPGACLRVYAGMDHLFRHGTGPSTPADYERPEPLSPQVIDDVAAWIKDGTCPP